MHRELTHGLELSYELLLAPLCPLFPVGVDGAEDRAAWLPAVVHRRYIQVVHQHNVWVLANSKDTQTKACTHVA